MDIKYCPHCGGESELTYNYSRTARSYFVFVKCSICGSQGKIFNTDTEPIGTDKACIDAVKAWNMRYREELKSMQEYIERGERRQ